MVKGREFTPQEARSGAKVAVLGATTAKQLFGESNPDGARIRINRVPFTVIGVLDTKGQSGFGQDQDDTIIIPISTMRNRIAGKDETVPNNVGTIQVQVDDANDLTTVQNEITDLMRERRKIQPGAENDFMIGNRAEFLRTRTQAMNTMSLLLAATGGVALIVGGIGIMNIMLVSVTERTREIGLRMAIGARRKVILSQFLGEATTLCLLGGIIGIILGSTISTIMAVAGGWPTTISFVTIITVAGGIRLRRDLLRLLSGPEGLHAQSDRGACDTNSGLGRERFPIRPPVFAALQITCCVRVLIVRKIGFQLAFDRLGGTMSDGTNAAWQFTLRLPMRPPIATSGR